MGSSKKEKKSKEKRKRKHKSQERSRSRSRERRHKSPVERSRSRSRERKHKKEKKHDRNEPENKRRREDRAERESNRHQQQSQSPVKEIKQGSPPRIKEEATGNLEPKSAGGDESLSIEETNRMRAKLGLKPLNISADKKVESKSKKEDVHRPAGNISEQKRQEELRQKLMAAKEKRRVNKMLGKIKTLGESDSDDDAHAWVEKSRKRQKEKELAEKTAKMLEQMDEEFGIGDLVEKELGTRKEYGSKDLKGLKVEHGQDRFTEGKTTILTLKDKGILDEDNEDTLVNVNIEDDERAAVNVQNKLKKPDYKPYDEPEYDEYGMFKSKEILEKYNEEIDGKKKEKFALGAGGKYDASHEKRMQEMRSELQEQQQSLTLPPPKIVSEYLTQEEMSFKKVKKKVRKIRKKNKVVTAEDLMPLTEDATTDDMGNRRNRRRRQQEEGELEEEVTVKEEPSIPGLDLVVPMPQDLITDDTEAPDEDLSRVVVEEDGAALELQLALNKTRKLNTKAQRSNAVQHIAETVKIKQEESDSDTEKSAQKGRGGNIVLNGTSEFCRSLGDIPTYGQAGNRAEEEEDELMDFERELQERRRAMEEEEEGAGPGWQQVEVMDTQPVELDDTEEHNVMEEEPVLNSGLGAALNLAKKKGFLEKEQAKLLTNTSKNRIEADNYSIEDKRYDDLDDKFSRKRDRFSSGMVEDFKEKRGYRPDIKLEYFDEHGHQMNHKEAFRYLSHRFHGKGSGKLKTEKRKKKLDQEQVMIAMSSSDTPLNTTAMLKDKLKQEQTPFLVLSGTKTAASSLTKS